jgi:CheY-like chemotaxis protein
MIKLLLVEDDVHKRDQLQSFSRDRFPAVSVRHSSSLIGGLRSLREWEPDIVLLDMTLPNYDPSDDAIEGSMQAFGGEEFLRQVRRFALSPSVIVVTQFETFGDSNEEKDREQLDSELKAAFPGIYRGMVYYHASLSSWSDELDRIIREALRDRSPQ